MYRTKEQVRGNSEQASKSLRERTAQIIRRTSNKYNSRRCMCERVKINGQAQMRPFFLGLQPNPGKIMFSTIGLIFPPQIEMLVLSTLTCLVIISLDGPPIAFRFSTLCSKSKTSAKTSSSNFGWSSLYWASVRSASVQDDCSASATARPETWCVSRKGTPLRTTEENGYRISPGVNREESILGPTVVGEIRREHVHRQGAGHLGRVNLERRKNPLENLKRHVDGVDAVEEGLLAPVFACKKVNFYRCEQRGCR